MPPRDDPRVTSYWHRRLTPDGLSSTRLWVGVPLETKGAPTQSSSTRKSGSNIRHDRLQSGCSLPVRSTQSGTKAQSSGKKKTALRFFNVTQPGDLKDRSQLRLNRQHVMHTYLDQERQKPPGQRDVRVDGPDPKIRRKRSTILMPAPFSAGSGPIGQPSNRGDPTTPESSCASCREMGQRNKHKTGRQKKLHRATECNSSRPELITGLNGTWDNSCYLQASWADIPWRSGAGADPDATVGSALNPFNTWPAFSDELIDVNYLKWSCSRRFGSLAIAQFWVPELLRARHAFLSTLCISSAHDDIMVRAQGQHTPPWLSTRQGIERMRVRQEVVSMVSTSLDDPELRVADVTIVAVLHLLNSEIMGCDDRVMKTHQDGLHRMVRQRGGLEWLGLHGQLARVLVITMYIIAALRESPPHSEFIAYASRNSLSIPKDNPQTPESPIYTRPFGFQTINRGNCTSMETWDLLNTLHDLSKQFMQQQLSPAPNSDSTTTPALSVLRDKVFTLRPASEIPSFTDSHARYAYESLRLTALLYAHALSTRTPFSTAARQLTSGTAAGPIWTPGLSATSALHIQIRDALLHTDLSDCWGAMAGVLFWVALIVGAAANPGLLVNGERVDREEDARRVLAAVTVRCSVLLSFEHGVAVLETVRRIVAIEGLLAEGRGGCVGEGVSETRRPGLCLSEPGIGTIVDGRETFGPEERPKQECCWTQMADFAWDSEGW